MVIAGGRLLSDGPLARLREAFGGERWLKLDLREPAEALDAGSFGARLVNRDGGRVCLAFDPGRRPAGDLIAAVSARHAISDLFVENPPIEEIVTRIYDRHGAKEGRT
jgi:ABC-2 type transport system ATP-binding protein